MVRDLERLEELVGLEERACEKGDRDPHGDGDEREVDVGHEAALRNEGLDTIVQTSGLRVRGGVLDQRIRGLDVRMSEAVRDAHVCFTFSQ